MHLPHCPRDKIQSVACSHGDHHRGFAICFIGNSVDGDLLFSIFIVFTGAVMCDGVYCLDLLGRLAFLGCHSIYWELC